ncbi:MAG: hydantoinase B/oxoprolinase family protein, partial [Alphaproteobacteria bacterium]
MPTSRRKPARARTPARWAGAITRPAGVAARRRAQRLDPVTAEIVRGYMETVAFEMATHVSLTATTPILNQSNERNATILDARGCLAALSVGIPQFMLSSTLPVRFALEFFGPDGLHDGDVL